MFLIRNVSQFAYNQNEESVEIPEEELPFFKQSAVWCIAGSLSIILFAMTIMALLDKPLDGPGTLRINNRYGRLASRFVFIIVVCTVPIKEHIDPILFLGIASVGLQMVATYEWYASLETGGTGLIEPRSLAVMVAKDKQKHGRKHPSNAQVTDPAATGANPERVR